MAAAGLTTTTDPRTPTARSGAEREKAPRVPVLPIRPEIPHHPRSHDEQLFNGALSRQRACPAHPADARRAQRCRLPQHDSTFALTPPSFLLLFEWSHRLAGFGMVSIIFANYAATKCRG